MVQANPAINSLEASSVSKISSDSLFVIGRNIYQAADGGSDNARAFINDFMSTTSSYPEGKRKAILDGMLFEIFFDKDGQRRDGIKGRYFDEVFKLQQYEEVKNSFDFIAQSLTATGGDFYAVPGKGHDVSVTVATKKTKDGNIVKSIYIGGVDVLQSKTNGPKGTRRIVVST